MATRPRLLKADAEMQRWSAALEEELATWPDVTSRPMFGMVAYYREKKIFAAIPRTRAPETPFSLMVKLPKVRHARLGTGRRPAASAKASAPKGEKWATFAMESQDDIAEALEWLGRAYERARER